MRKWTMCLCLLAVFVLWGPVRAAAGEELQKPQNPDGMTVDLLYVLEDGTETVVKRVNRVIISAGTAEVTVELQEKLLPEGYVLKDPRNLPLGEEEIRIPVEKAEEKPDEKPTEPTEKPTEPAEKPTEPTEKPTEPAEKPTKPSEKPVKPAEKPSKPSEKPHKPHPDNPKTGDSAVPVFMGISLLLSGLSLAALLKKRVSRN